MEGLGDPCDPDDDGDGIDDTAVERSEVLTGLIVIPVGQPCAELEVMSVRVDSMRCLSSLIHVSTRVAWCRFVPSTRGFVELSCQFISCRDGLFCMVR